MDHEISVVGAFTVIDFKRSVGIAVKAPASVPVGAGSNPLPGLFISRVVIIILIYIIYYSVPDLSQMMSHAFAWLHSRSLS